jgi:hypothetical protein
MLIQFWEDGLLLGSQKGLSSMELVNVVGNIFRFSVVLQFIIKMILFLSLFTPPDANP